MHLLPPPRNVAVVHDWLVDRGGSERVLEHILSLFPGAVLYTLIDRMHPDDRARLGPGRRVESSFLQHFPRIERWFTKALPLMPVAIEQFDLTGHDLVISSSHCVAKGVTVPPEALHLCYCHSPMRYAWDLQGETLRSEGLDRGWRTVPARWLLHRLRLWDATSHHGVDALAANSRFVQQRILKAWRRSSEVIHPPVADLADDPAPRRPRPGHFVSVGRLIGYKNLAQVVQAFALTPELQLTIVGEGPQRRMLERMLPSNVRLTGRLPQDQVRELLAQAHGFVFAATEDFGIAPVEALAAGVPVVALGRGGTLDYLTHGHDAWLFDRAQPAVIAAAVREAAMAFDDDGVTRTAWADRCRATAHRFRPERFRAEFGDWVQRHWNAWHCAPAPGATNCSGTP